MANTFTLYEQEARRTAPTLADRDDAMLFGALGLAGESGEYVDHIKKYVYHGHAPDREKALDELGDILWYIAHAARAAVRLGGCRVPKQHETAKALPLRLFCRKICKSP